MSHKGFLLFWCLTMLSQVYCQSSCYSCYAITTGTQTQVLNIGLSSNQSTTLGSVCTASVNYYTSLNYTGAFGCYSMNATMNSSSSTINVLAFGWVQMPCNLTNLNQTVPGYSGYSLNLNSISCCNSNNCNMPPSAYLGGNASTYYDRISTMLLVQFLALLALFKSV